MRYKFLASWAVRKIVSIKSLLLLLAVTSLISLIHLGTIPFRSEPVSKLSSQQRDLLSAMYVNVFSRNQNWSEQTCFLPSLHVNDSVMMAFYSKLRPFQCPQTPRDWVSVEGGNLVFSRTVQKEVGDFSCSVSPVVRTRGDDSIQWGSKVNDVQDGYAITSDFFKVDCATKSRPSKTYSEVHLGLAPRPNLDKRFAEVKPPANGLGGYSILMMGFDSMSRMSWLRRLPETRNYFVNRLGAIELEGYNIMGDGTPAALFPILTGHHEQEMTEARRNFKGAQYVDGMPWIWKDFVKAGYLTSWADSEVLMAPFTMRLLGFKEPPTDFYMRPYYLGIDHLKKRHSPGCRGPLVKHQIWLQWARDLMYKYSVDPKFMVHFYATLTHGNNNPITQADHDIASFLRDLEVKGHLNRTVVVLFGDHGCRFSEVRATWSGKMEERLPYVAFRFPPSFREEFPQLVRNFQHNVKRLTTPMDIHETFKDFIRFDGAGMGNVKNRGISLFKEIPLERDCQHANISNHWCACLSWQPLSASDAMAEKALQEAINTINRITYEYRDDCVELSVRNVTSIMRASNNKDMVNFQKSKDIHGLVPEFKEKALKNRLVLYQVTFFVKPSDGQYEVTVTHEVETGVMVVKETDISRINKYGNDSACILDKNRQLRQYCYCRSKVKG